MSKESNAIADGYAPETEPLRLERELHALQQRLGDVRNPVSREHQRRIRAAAVAAAVYMAKRLTTGTEHNDWALLVNSLGGEPSRERPGVPTPTLWLWVDAEQGTMTLSADDPERQNDGETPYEVVLAPGREPGIKTPAAHCYVNVLRNVLERVGVRVVLA